MYYFSILNCFIFSFWRAVFIWEFSFPLLLSFTYCTFIYVYTFLFCALVKRILNLNLNLSKKTESSQQQYLSISSSTFCSTLSLARLASISRYYFIVSLRLFPFLRKRNGAPCISTDYSGFIFFLAILI